MFIKVSPIITHVLTQNVLTFTQKYELSILSIQFLQRKNDNKSKKTLK